MAGTKFTIEQVTLSSGTKICVEGATLDKGYTTPAALESFIGPVKLTGNQTISGVKTFASPPRSSGALTGNATELPNVTQIGTLIGARGIAPLIDWQLNGWYGSGSIPSKGASISALTVTGGVAIEGTAGFGRQLNLDGVDDYAVGGTKDEFNRIHQGLDFTLLLEGESVLTADAAVRCAIATNYNSASVGFFLFQQSGQLNASGYGFAGPSLSFTGTLRTILLRRSGSVVTLRVVNSSGTVTEAVGTSGIASGDSSGFVTIGKGAITSEYYSPSKISRVRLWDRALDL